MHVAGRPAGFLYVRYGVVGRRDRASYIETSNSCVTGSRFDRRREICIGSSLSVWALHGPFLLIIHGCGSREKRGKEGKKARYNRVRG